MYATSQFTLMNEIIEEFLDHSNIDSLFWVQENSLKSQSRPKNKQNKDRRPTKRGQKRKTATPKQGKTKNKESHSGGPGLEDET